MSIYFEEFLNAKCEPHMRVFQPGMVSPLFVEEPPCGSLGSPKQSLVKVRFILFLPLSRAATTVSLILSQSFGTQITPTIINKCKE